MLLIHTYPLHESLVIPEYINNSERMYLSISISYLPYLESIQARLGTYVHFFVNALTLRLEQRKEEHKESNESLKISYK
jgi:hypothetical protein